MKHFASSSQLTHVEVLPTGPYWVQALARVVFAKRLWVLWLFALLTVGLAYLAFGLQPNASLRSMVPTNHPYVRNALSFENELRPLGNVVRIVVHNRQGDIYQAQFLQTLRQVTDAVFFIPGVDRAQLSSLWTPNVMWRQVTEDGLRMGPVIDQGFTGTAEQLQAVRLHVELSGRVGSLVANDHQSAIVLAPLLEIDPDTGLALDYGLFAQRLENEVRKKFSSNTVDIRIVGFAQWVGDLIQGAQNMVGFFGLTVLLSTLLLWLYSRCWRSTLVTVLCCVIAVVWQLGAMRLLGLGLDPYTLLVPFLTFAIGMSHAIQNVWAQMAQRHAGATPKMAARRSMEALFVPGTVALLADVVGFATLWIIDIGVIRNMALAAALGVAVVIVSKMLLLPVLMSYINIAPAALAKVSKHAFGPHRLCLWLGQLTQPKWARRMAWGLCILLIPCVYISTKLHVGDIHAGAPELKPNSRYNQDVRFLVEHYSTSADVFVVMVKTQEGQCGSYPVATLVDQFQWVMQNTPGVDSTVSLFSVMKTLIAAQNGGHPKWMALSRDQYIRNGAHKSIPTGFYNATCSMLPVVLFLQDHKADTLHTVTQAVEVFAKQHPNQHAQFLLAAGNAGIEAATNQVVQSSQTQMLVLVYGIVTLLVALQFRSLKVVLALMLPLFLTELLCKVVMVGLGLGIKVATLPVIALGVGIGVDYGIYLYSRLQHLLAQGLSFQAAYVHTLHSTGAAVAMTALTMALGVMLWCFSSIQFQIDMGVLLMFMFIWNMVGAVVLMPVLLCLLGMPGSKLSNRSAEPTQCETF